jgi:hypothetical protein
VKRYLMDLSGLDEVAGPALRKKISNLDKAEIE